MKNYRRTLPPLDSLLFFHAAARTKSLTVAAEELFVTQAAVSKRIQRLEEWLGAELFSRDGRNLKITAAGRDFASDVEMALEFLDRAVAKLKVPGQPVVRIAANTALSMFWLYARIKEFSLGDVSCEVSVVMTDSTSELLSDANDLALVYCDGKIPGWDCRPIIDVEMAPAAAPEVAKQAEMSGLFSKTPAQEAVPAILEYENLTPDWINWQYWLKGVGVDLPEGQKTIRCNSYVQSVGRALEGEGVALINVPVMQEELEAGKLVLIGSNSLKPQTRYHLCRKTGTQLTGGAKDLFEFLSDTK